MRSLCVSLVGLVIYWHFYLLLAPHLQGVPLQSLVKMRAGISRDERPVSLCLSLYVTTHFDTPQEFRDIVRPSLCNNHARVADEVHCPDPKLGRPVLDVFPLGLRQQMVSPQEDRLDFQRCTGRRSRRRAVA